MTVALKMDRLEIKYVAYLTSLFLPALGVFFRGSRKA